MKRRIVAAMLAGVMALGMLAGCGGSGKSDSDGGSSDKKSSDANIAVFYYTYSDTYIASVRTALDAKLDEMGVEYQDYDGNSNQTTQNEQIDTAIQTGATALIVNIVTSGSVDASSQIVEKAEAAGIPVIFFNRAIEDDKTEGDVLGSYDKCAFVGTDAPEAGHMQGKMIGEYVLEHYDELDLNGDGKISYAMFKGDEANVEAIYRTQYGVEDANAVLTAAGKPELVYFDANNTSGYQVDLNGQWSAAAALDYMNTNLSQYNEGNNNMIELIICNNDNMAEGCISALESAGYNNGTGKTIPVFGVDATDSAKELIANGKMTGTVKQDAEGMAAAIAQIAKAVGEGTALKDAVAATAESNTEMYSVAEGVATKLYVAYAPYTA